MLTDLYFYSIVGAPQLAKLTASAPLYIGGVWIAFIADDKNLAGTEFYAYSTPLARLPI